jgi:hypothetical protein
VPGASYPAVSTDGDVFAALGPARGTLRLQVVGAPQAEQPVVAVGLTAPSFDPLGWVWTASADGGGVYATRAGNAAVSVEAPWLKGGRVVSLRASRDGARLLLTVRQGSSVRAVVTGVVRDDKGRPQRLTKPYPLLADLTTALDAAWVDEDEVVVLGRRAGQPGGEQPWLIQIGGTARDAGTDEEGVSGAESITAGNGPLALVAGSPAGLLTRVGGRWEPDPAGRWPAFPG